MKSKFILFMMLIASQLTFSQQRTCGMQQKMDRIMASPDLKQKYLEQQAKFETEYQRLITEQEAFSKNATTVNNINATILIPVAVHFPDAEPSSCLQNLAQTQINILNADYNATNSDISQWTAASSFFPGVNTGNLNIQFVLATQNHPANSGLSNGELAVTFGTNFLNGDDFDTTWSGYMNLVCRDAGSGILGYSPLGGVPGDGETVVIALSAFGSGSGCAGYVPGAPYNLGRTLTHEIGHFFNLNHTFAGCSNTNCATQGDRICDTPPSNTATGGCPTPGSTVKCGVNTLTMNYMDYTNDACMYMFTAGQATRMLAYYNTIASQFLTNTLSNNEFLAANFAIAPNPNNGSFTIQFKDLTNTSSIEVFDITGRVVYENNFNVASENYQTVNLQNPTSGVYFINVKSGSSIVTKKIIIE